MSTVAEDLAVEPGRSSRRLAPAMAAAIALALIMGWVWWSFFALTEDQSYRVLFSAGTADTGTATAGAGARAAGQRLSTGDDGFITVRLSDGSVVKLMPNTTLDIEDARANAAGDSFATGLRLLSGEIESTLERGDGSRRDLSVFSNSVAIGVRGTVFTVMDDGSEARLMVTRGRVEAGGNVGETASVKAGEGTVVRSGEALGEVTALPDPPTDLAPATAAETGISLAWRSPDAWGAYLVEIAEDEAFQRLLSRHRVEWTTGIVPPLSKDGRYFWRVASIDGRGLRGPFSRASILDHDYYIERSRAALQRRDTSGALSNLSRSLSGLDPEIDALRSQGRLLLASGDLKGARRTLTTVLDLRPEDHDARNILARADFLGLDYSDAEALYSRVADAGAPDQVDTARVGIALIRVRQGRFQEGLDTVLKVIERSPRHVEGLNVAAMASVGLGDRQQASRFVRQVLEIAPGDPTAMSLARSLEKPPSVPRTDS